MTETEALKQGLNRPSSRFLVVVHTEDVVGERMAGPGIRAWHLATQLSNQLEVALVARFRKPDPASFSLVEYGSEDARRLLRDASVVIGQPGRSFKRRRKGQKIVFDLFDPVVLELRELYGRHPTPRQRLHLAAEWWRLRTALRKGDLLIHAAPKQIEFYQAAGQVRAPWIEVPFGIDPAEVTSCPKPQANVVLWGGGVWEWLDPETAVEAVLRVNESGLHCRLLFLGIQRPNAESGDRTRDSRFAGLLARGGAVVSANEEWTPFHERLSWLRSSKIAIMLHRPAVEAEYSIRTRLFDAIAAAVPVVATEKGFAAELVRDEGLGIVVPAQDVAAVAAAIEKLLTDDDFHQQCVNNMKRLQSQRSWRAAVRPLIEQIADWKREATP